MAGAGPAGAPAPRWKGHIIRQLRQRDRAQKALFLDLVPACECARGWADGHRGERLWAPGEGSSDFWGGDPGAAAPRHLVASEAVCCALDPSVTTKS